MPSDRGDLLRGTLEMLILRTLTGGPKHGYGITERIQAVTEDVLKIEEGSLYPALYRMQRRGWVTSAWGRSKNNRRAKYYKLTAKGRRQLEAVTESWTHFSEAVTKAMKAI